MDEFDLLLGAAFTAAFALGVVATLRLYCWFVEPARRRPPSAAEPA